MNRDLFIVQSTSGLRTVFESSREYFDSNALILMCLDSNRQVATLTHLFENAGIEHSIVEGKLRIPPVAVDRLFSARGILCGFDAMLVMPSHERIRWIPRFDHTTESAPFSSEELQVLGDDMIRASALAFLSDGNGFLGATFDAAFAKRMASAAQDSSLKVLCVSA